MKLGFCLDDVPYIEAPHSTDTICGVLCVYGSAHLSTHDGHTPTRQFAYRLHRHAFNDKDVVKGRQHRSRISCHLCGFLLLPELQRSPSRIRIRTYSLTCAMHSDTFSIHIPPPHRIFLSGNSSRK